MENPKPLANGGLIDYDEWPLIVVSDKPVTNTETVDKIQAEFDALKDKLREVSNGDSNKENK